MTTRNVLVTGACGYLGSQLMHDLGTAFDTVDRLHVRALDNLQSGDSRALMDLPEEGTYEFLEGDVLDPSMLRVALRDIDAVVHLAAVVQTPFSFEDPNWVEQVNHWGTSHLLEACLSAEVDRFVYASTGAVYGTGGCFEEGDPCDPVGAYANAKHRAERAVRAADERGLETTILRMGVLFGEAPVVRFDAVANKFARLAGVRKPLTIYGEGGQKRPFLHVRDASNAIASVLDAPGTFGSHTLNVVGTNASILDLAETIQEAEPETDIRHTDQDIRTHLSFEISGAAIARLGWTPSESLHSGLSELLDRFRGFEPSHLSKRGDLEL